MITICIMWVCVKRSPQQLGVVVYCWFCLTLAIISIILIQVQMKICGMFDSCMGVYFSVCQREKFLFVRKPSMTGKIAVLTARTLAPVRWRCHLWGPLEMDFQVSFLESLLLRIFDALIVVDVWTHRTSLMLTMTPANIADTVNYCRILKRYIQYEVNMAFHYNIIFYVMYA